MNRKPKRKADIDRQVLDRGSEAPQRHHLSDLRDRPRYVLLGEPGSGKTTAFQREAEAAGIEPVIPTPAASDAFDRLTRASGLSVTVQPFFNCPARMPWKMNLTLVAGEILSMTALVGTQPPKRFCATIAASMTCFWMLDEAGCGVAAFQAVSRCRTSGCCA